MEIEVLVLVTKLDGQVVNAVPVSDCYTEASISLQSEYLTDEDIIKYYCHMSREGDAKRIEDVRSCGVLCDDQEAKDLPVKLSRYEVVLDTYKLEVK